MPLSDRENSVCALIARRQSALLDDLRLHVGLPTGGRNTAALDETRGLLAARAGALGAKCELLPGVPRPDWLYGEKPGQTPLPVAMCRRTAAAARREFLIAGHLDTVHDPAGPFKSLAVASDGKAATGPGCVDMKGGLVIALAALEALEEAGERLSWSLLLNSDEETGSYHSAPVIAAEAARVAKAGGLGIALEPATADGGLVIERAGSAQIVVEVHGTPAHVGRDFRSGVSAVLQLAGLITTISALGDPSSGLIVNFGPLQGGAATNVVPDHARAWGNVRFSTPSQWQAFETRLRGFAGPRVSGAAVNIETSVGRPAKPETPEVLRFANLCRDAAVSLGQNLPFARTAGVCDGNLMQAAGLPTLDTLGVRGGGLHTPQEWIDLSSLVERCQLLAVVMMRASVDT
jgi:glutamate carboxypeptidase